MAALIYEAAFTVRFRQRFGCLFFFAFAKRNRIIGVFPDALASWAQVALKSPTNPGGPFNEPYATDNMNRQSGDMKSTYYAPSEFIELARVLAIFLAESYVA